MGCLRVKPGVKIEKLPPGGAAIIGALFRTAIQLPYDLIITSGSDGAHSGPNDPHHRGEAFDVHSKSLSPADQHSVLVLVMGYLQETTAWVLGAAKVEEASGGFATDLFFGFLEAPGTEHEHWHFQTRKGREFPNAALKRA